MPYKNKEEQLASQRRWYQRNKDKRKIEIRNREKSIVKWFKEYKKTLKCTNCPENHPATLVFHHNDGEKKECGIADMPSKGYS